MMSTGELEILMTPVFEAIMKKVMKKTKTPGPKEHHLDTPTTRFKRWYRELDNTDHAQGAKMLTIIYTHCVWRCFDRMLRYVDEAKRHNAKPGTNRVEETFRAFKVYVIEYGRDEKQKHRAKHARKVRGAGRA